MFPQVIRPALYLIIFTFAASAVFAQRTPRPSSLPTQVHGQVRYAVGGAPVDHALVRLESFRGGVIAEGPTDRTGNFVFTGLVPDQYLIVVRFPGFNESQQRVDLNTATSEYVLVQLVRSEPESRSSDSSKRSAVVDAGVLPKARTEFDRAETALRGGSEQAIAEAVQHFENAVRIDPRYLEAWLRLGTAYMDLKEWNKAEPALRKTLEINRRTVNALFALGETYLRENKYDQAEKVLRDGLTIETHSAPAHLTLAHVYRNKGLGIKDEAERRPSFEKSYQEVNEALNLNPELAAAHLLKGDLYFRARRAEDALREFEEYLRLDPKGPFAEQTKTLCEKIRKALADTSPTKPPG